MQVVKNRIISRIRKIFFVWIFVQIGFVFPADTGDIIITEFFFNKSDGTLPEYVELFNTTIDSIDLHGWKVEIDGIPVEIDVPFNIDSFDYAVILSFTGQLRSYDETDSTETTYCSSYHKGVYNVCDSTIDNLFWRYSTFSDLSNPSDSIKIFYNSDTPIDVVAYDSTANFPVGDDVLGRAAVFIIDPRSDSSHVKNDYGFNWRSSEHESEWLWNGAINEKGSPLIANFITPEISIKAITNSEGDSTIHVNSDSNIFRPPSDGIPGGYATIELTGSAINADGADVTLDYLYWKIDSSNVPVQDTIITDSPIWSPSRLHIDTSTQMDHSIIYKVPLFTRDTLGFMGKTGTTIYLEQEINYPPVVDSINGLVGGTIEIFEDDSLLLYGFVTDTELCNSSIISCTHDDLFYPNPYFGYLGSTFGSNESYDNFSPFLWISNSENLDNLNTIFSLETVFRPDSIISVGDISANSIRDTLEFQLKATDPFGATGTNSVTVIVHNNNVPPILDTISNQDTDEDTPITFVLNASDLDGDTLTYSARIEDSLKANVIISGSSLTIQPTLNFNGDIDVIVTVTDGQNSNNEDNQPFTVTVEPVNDKPKSFSILPDIFSYHKNLIDTSAFFVGSDTLYYFRLPQDSTHNSIVSNNILRFQWDKNNQPDPEMDPELNNGDSLHLFYRLEAILNESTYIILKDSINHQDFFGDSLIFTEINVTDGFPYYLGKYEDHKNNGIKFLDDEGKISYKWRVVAQNYPDDPSIDDPPRECSGWENTDFRIDLIQPRVTNLYIMLNEMYAGFYDLLWSSTEAFLTDSTLLSIKEEAFQFPEISMLNPRRITDNLFHFTGIIPTDLESAIITFDLDIRDNAMNSGGVREDIVSYKKHNPDTGSRLISPSNNVTIFLQKNSVSEPVHIFITEENSNITSRESNTELYQLTPTIHFYPNELILNKPGSIYFDISDYLSSEYEPWQLTIFEINDTESISLTTNISEGMLTASIDKLGDYAVFVNTAIEKPLPTKFELKMNYPNPFNPSTTIPIELPEESFVEVAIYNILGEKITVLSKGVKSSGYHNIHWNGKNQFGKPVSSGIYFVSVHLGQKIYHQKMMLLK